MMTCFYQASTLRQIVLLVISQFTVISLASELILLFGRKRRMKKLIQLALLFVVNVTFYILMQLDSRINGIEQGLHLNIPYGLLLIGTVVSLIFGMWNLFSETRNRKTIGHSSIKEAFDNLPTGVCYFNEAGLPVLCNRAMQRFSFEICGKDVQLIADMENCLGDDFSPAAGVRKEGKTFLLPDGRAWQLEKRVFTHESGSRFSQYVAADVTDLHRNRVELIRENEQLRKVQADLKRLSANVVAVTREEEILNMKMRVHDEMGRCLVAAQKYLRQENNEHIPDRLATDWQRAVSMIKYSNDAPEEDMLLQIRETCAYFQISFVQTGALPEQEEAAYLLTCAVRECVTNAVRYAQATELYVAFEKTTTEASVTIRNNGEIPRDEIVEGGGLSTLRQRVERAGGMMAVQSQPFFLLRVTVPLRKEEIL